jgi:hypothetical protein
MDGGPPTALNMPRPFKQADPPYMGTAAEMAIWEQEWAKNVQDVAQQVGLQNLNDTQKYNLKHAESLLRSGVPVSQQRYASGGASGSPALLQFGVQTSQQRYAIGAAGENQTAQVVGKRVSQSESTGASASGELGNRERLTYNPNLPDGNARLTMVLDKVLKGRHIGSDGTEKNVFQWGAKGPICREVAKDINREQPLNSENKTPLFSDKYGKPITLTGDQVDFVWTRHLNKAETACDKKSLQANGSTAGGINATLLALYLEMLAEKARTTNQVQVCTPAAS